MAALALSIAVTSAGAAGSGTRSGPGSGTGPASTQAAVRPAWLSRLESWLLAVRGHTPNRADERATELSAWTEAELSLVIANLEGLQKLGRHERERATRGEFNRSYEYKKTTLTLANMKELLGSDWARPETWNAILERGALLHADIAMLVVPYRASNAGCRPGPTAVTSDGSRVGSGCECFHWAIGRALLDLVEPAPSSRAAVRLWYLATIASLLERRDYANAGPHVEHAQKVFPLDADILFQHGCYHDALTAPLVQVAVRDLALTLASAREQLTEAAELYRKTLVSDPSRAEARVRRGRILISLARYGEAADELQEALKGARRGQLAYYGELFLGDAAQSLGRDTAARDCYRRAAALYPDAQSPHLALSLLARRTGDRASALRELEQPLVHPFPDRARTDPWWAYYDWQERRAVDVWTELLNVLRPGASR